MEEAVPCPRASEPIRSSHEAAEEAEHRKLTGTSEHHRRESLVPNTDTEPCHTYSSNLDQNCTVSIFKTFLKSTFACFLMIFHVF
jgi:hypothetical protein